MTRADFPDGRFTHYVVAFRSAWTLRWWHTRGLSPGGVFIQWPQSRTGDWF